MTGGEDCIVRAWDTRSGELAWSVANAHSNRIKGVAILGAISDSGDDTGELPAMVASASSDGLLKVWDTRMMGSEDGVVPVPLMQAETKARLTCLVSSSGVKSKFSVLILVYISRVASKQIKYSHHVRPSNGEPSRISSPSDAVATQLTKFYYILCLFSLGLTCIDGV